MKLDADKSSFCSFLLTFTMKKPASEEDARREIRILNFAVSIASKNPKNKNIEGEEFRIFELFERLNGLNGFLEV